MRTLAALRCCGSLRQARARHSALSMGCVWSSAPSEGMMTNGPSLSCWRGSRTTGPPRVNLQDEQRSKPPSRLLDNEFGLCMHIAKVSALPRLVQAQAPRRRGQPSDALEWIIPNFLCRTQVKRKLAEHTQRELPSQLTSHSSAQLASLIRAGACAANLETFTKFVVFNITRYRRVLYLLTPMRLSRNASTCCGGSASITMRRWPPL